MKHTLSLITDLLLCLLAPCTVLHVAQLYVESATTPDQPNLQTIAATFSNVPYGKHERQVLDFYQSKSDKPTPVVFLIHGGAWNAGNKEQVTKNFLSFGGTTNTLEDFLKAGISVVSINYRYIRQAEEAKVTPPVIGPLHDAARALQLIRSKAAEWNIDKNRIVACGGSAGGASSLWLVLHDDLRETSSADLIARESSRPNGAAVLAAQTTLDPKQIFEWIPNTKGYGGHALGVQQDRTRNLSSMQVYLADREKFLPWIAEYSPIELITADDPPIFLCYRDVPALGKDAKDPTHTANYGVKFYEKCQSVGAKCEFVHGGSPDRKTRTVIAYLFEVFSDNKHTQLNQK